jgi:hypothetical protein
MNVDAMTLAEVKALARKFNISPFMAEPQLRQLVANRLKREARR